MNKVWITFLADETLKADFLTAAKAINCNGDQLLRDFMRDFVKKQNKAVGTDEWFRSQVQIGLDQANAGNLIPASEVESKFAAKRMKARYKA